MRILGISAFYHDSAAALSKTAISSPPRRKSASAGRSMMRAFPHMLSSIALPRLAASSMTLILLPSTISRF